MKNFFTSLEKFSCSFYPMFYAYHNYYRNVMRKEIELANITSKDIVLNIGCGSVPFTAIHIAQITGAKVIAIDKDKEAVMKAKKALKRYGLEKNIEVKLSDGIKEELMDFTVAVVALHVKDKVAMLEKLLKAGKPGGRIIFRQPVDSYKEEYGYLPSKYIPSAVAYQSMKAFKESYLFLIP